MALEYVTTFGLLVRKDHRGLDGGTCSDPKLNKGFSDFKRRECKLLIYQISLTSFFFYGSYLL